MSVKLKFCGEKRKGRGTQAQKNFAQIIFIFFQTSLIHRELIFVSVHDGINTTCSSRICC